MSTQPEPRLAPHITRMATVKTFSSTVQNRTLSTTKWRHGGYVQLLYCLLSQAQAARIAHYLTYTILSFLISALLITFESAFQYSSSIHLTNAFMRQQVAINIMTKISSELFLGFVRSQQLLCC